MCKSQRESDEQKCTAKVWKTAKKFFKKLKKGVDKRRKL